jgi:hypothetical protein
VRIVEVDDRQHELGFCGAVQYGWQQLATFDDYDYVFHLEEDWRFLRTFDLGAMARLLATDPSIAQVALRRGPAHPAEAAAGGLIEMWPEHYTDCYLDGDAWLTHRLFFTTNPCLYRRDLALEEWPDAPLCEPVFGERLIERGCSFAFWGARSDAPWIEHTGVRSGVGY